MRATVVVLYWTQILTFFGKCIYHLDIASFRAKR